MAKLWRSLSTVLQNFRNVHLTQYARQKRLGEAYRAVFHGSPSSEDQEIVLADLLTVSGFTRAFGPNVTNDELRHAEGKRVFYGHIFSFLSLDGEDVRALENAARLEAAVSSEQRGS